METGPAPPERRSSIVRSTLTGMFVGGALSICNIYSGLKVGWSPNMGVTSALLAYGFWRLRSSARIARSPFTLLETNLAQAGASAAAAVVRRARRRCSGALTLLTGMKLSWVQLAAWVLSVVLLGNVLAVPLRQSSHSPLVSRSFMKVPRDPSSAGASRRTEACSKIRRAST